MLHNLLLIERRLSHRSSRLAVPFAVASLALLALGIALRLAA
jgi:hypothetical protein